MPIYMDRHYHVDFTPSAVAKAHRIDLENQDKHGVNFMTYWFDEERKTIFCLVDAPNVDAVQDAHNDIHAGEINEIIEVDESLVQAFLGRVADPTPIHDEQIEVGSAFRVIIFTDLKDSTLMASQYGDEVALELLQKHNEITRNAIIAHDGREIKHTGDGFMLSFYSATNAVECAIQIQHDFASYNNRSPEVPLHLRIGLSAGEPVQDNEQLFGLAVNLAARLCASAEPDNILVAQVVRDLCLGKDITFNDLGEIIPKGFELPVRIFEVLW